MTFPNRTPRMKRRDWLRLSVGGALALPAFAAEDIPAHPSRLEFAPLKYDPPESDQYRHELPNGAVAYLVEDHELPLIGVGLTVRVGGYMTGDDEVGLASFTGSQMRSGGTTSISARDFDEEAAFLATQIGSSIGSTSGSASVNTLTKNLERSLEMFFDMLKNPGFDAQRLELSRAQALQSMERRNDNTGGIAGREWRRLMRSPEFFTARSSTKATIEGVSIEKMQALHQAYYRPENFIFAVAGDFDTDDMLKRLGEAMKMDWPGGNDVASIPKPSHTPKPGVFMVHKEDPNLNQAQVRIGHLGIERSNPDHIAVGVMNDILGGSGFTSRITTRVRSDEGLAYSARSAFPAGTYYPGAFTASFQSQNPRCAQAASIVLEEMRRIREEKVTAEELETSKNSAIEVFPRYFATAGQVAGTFAGDEYTKREKGYWTNYRDRISDVTIDDVLRVAQKYLKPEAVAILAVGNTDEVLAGNPDKPEYDFKKLDGDGKIEMIPLPDPLTMEYPEG